jgi:hypothetical protein
LAMNLLLLLALAVPLSCLALLSLLALLGVMTLGGVIHVLGTVRAHRPQWPSVEPGEHPHPVGAYLHQPRPSLDHLVGGSEQRRGDCDAKCLGCLEVDHEVELGWQLYGQIGRLFAPQNAVHIEGG